ncbi:MAG: gluconokinase [Henriciella sp.]
MNNPIMVMGITAAGKSVIGIKLSSELGCDFVEGDGLHPITNTAKMRAGIPLTDEDRSPWLGRIGEVIQAKMNAGTRVVFSCSALKAAYREQLRQTIPGLITIYLQVDPLTAEQRSLARSDHFMPASLVQSQWMTLQVPTNEPNTVTVDTIGSTEEVLERALDALRALYQSDTKLPIS